MPYAPAAEPGKRYASIFCVLMHPLSRGSVHIASGDALAAPSIDPNYLANTVDLDMLAASVALALKVYQTEPMSRHVRRPTRST